LIRLILLLSFLGLSALTSSAQISNKLTLDFLTQFSKSNRNSGQPFVYSNGLHPTVLDGLIKQIEKSDKLASWEMLENKIHVIDTLILTKEEKQFILNELQKQADTTLWNQFHLPNSISIPRDTVRAIFSDKERGWKYFSKVYGIMNFDFSIPIFFRNNQYCVFYYGTDCGRNCGDALFAIYRKEYGAWSIWISIYQMEM
jgi:hypothetical protein